jgi:hypothetical protein
MDIAYTQWLFRCLAIKAQKSKRQFKVSVVDAAYNAAKNLISLITDMFELPRELPSVAAIAVALR